MGQDIGPFSLDIVKGYFIYIMAFAGGIYANMQGLKELSPETTTVVRCDYAIMHITLQFDPFLYPKDDVWHAPFWTSHMT